jgi:hypothetical protein
MKKEDRSQESGVRMKIENEEGRHGQIGEG